MFSEAEKKAIEEKLEQLGRVKGGNLSVQKLADSITARRVAWFEENRERLLRKYSGLPEEEKAWRIICFDHMKIDPADSRITRISSKKIRLDSYNFCPYLEACKELGLDTRYICKEIGEPSIQAICKMINPRLVFSRNYQNIRPHNPDFCEEYFEVV